MNRIIDWIARNIDVEWIPFSAGYQLDSSVELLATDASGSCGNGGRRSWKLVNAMGDTIEAGFTCECGRGCGGSDCIVDDWGYHDTVLEKYRVN